MKRRFVYTWYIPPLPMVAGGSYHSLYVEYVNNQTWTWGNNLYGRLGDNTTTDRCTPVSIHGTKKTFCSISAGTMHSLGIDFRGQVWSWGENNSGRLGDNSVTNRCTPVSIHGTQKTFCSISGGNSHSLGLDLRGQVWSWGDSEFGQLGVNDTTHRLTPVSIHGSSKTFCSISAAGSHSLGVDYIGQVWGWGYNYSGQLGDNTTDFKCIPVSIHGNQKTFCSIAGGNFHSLGIDLRGQVWCWGNNNRGQVGDNSITNRCTPVSIHGTKKTFCSISGGNSHSLGIDHIGQVWGWGYNFYGTLGDNSTTNKYTPVSIHGTKKTFCSISAGNDHSLGVDFRGQIWAWGYNNVGQLGDKSVTSRRTPVCVYYL